MLILEHPNVADVTDCQFQAGAPSLTLPKMRGLAFLEMMLATPHGSDRWRELFVGMFVFRVVETTVAHGYVDDKSVAYAREELTGIPNLPLKGRLSELLDIAASDQRRGRNTRRQIGTKLMAYGLELRATGSVGPAADIFALIYDELFIEADLRLQAMAERAYSLRMLSRHDDAELVYLALAAAAKAARMVRLRLDAELGLAKIAIDRGNLPLAEPMVRQVARRAARANDRLMLAKARRDLARIAGIRDRPADVVSFSALALQDIPAGAERDQALVDCSIAFRELGLASVARDAASKVVREAAGWNQRTAATLLLYHLSVDDRDEPSVVRYREQLEAETLTPVFLAEFQEARARDAFAVRRSPIEALLYVKRMLATAEKHSLNEIIFRAERALGDLSRGETPAMYEYRPPAIADQTKQSVSVAERTIAALCMV